MDHKSRMQTVRLLRLSVWLWAVAGVDCRVPYYADEYVPPPPPPPPPPPYCIPRPSGGIQYDNPIPELIGTVLEPFQDMFTPVSELPRSRYGFESKRITRICESGAVFWTHRNPEECVTCMVYDSPSNDINGWYPVQLDWLNMRQIYPRGRCSSGSKDGRQKSTTRKIVTSQPRLTEYNIGNTAYQLKIKTLNMDAYCSC